MLRVEALRARHGEWKLWEEQRALQRLAHSLTLTWPLQLSIPPPADCAARAAAALLRAGRHRAALNAATAILQLVSQLSFGTCDTALSCSAAIMSAKGTIRAAAEAGAPVTQHNAVHLLEAAARSDACLRLGKWYGHAFGDAVERFIAGGWGSPEVRGHGVREGASGVWKNAWQGGRCPPSCQPICTRLAAQLAHLRATLLPGHAPCSWRCATWPPGAPWSPWALFTTLPAGTRRWWAR